MIPVVFGLGGILIGGGIVFMVLNIINKKKIDSALNKSKKIIEDAKKQAEEIIEKGKISVKEWKISAQEKFERDTQAKRNELAGLEKKLYAREDTIDRKADLIEKKVQELQNREDRIKRQEEVLLEKEKKLSAAIDMEIKNLERIANLSQEDAKKELQERLIAQAEYEAANKLKEIEERLQEQTKLKAQEIISYSIQRMASEYVRETTITSVAIRDDDIKGRIIGREGRNIRAFENLTGVDLLIDDTPETIIISSFDPMRRHIAKIALEKLIEDGRIQPSRIEELVRQSEKEIYNEITKFGEEVVLELGIGKIHPELVKILGRLKFRTSFGQNALLHSKEVARLAANIAGELGLDIELAKRAGLLHDIGKGLDKEVEGNHQDIGADIAAKYGENKIVVNAIRAHHEDVPFESLIAVLVQAADALSASRPGARREAIDFYVKRVEKLEALARSFVGVEKVFAIQAGREVRVIVTPSEIDDRQSVILSRNIAKKIEQEVKYPGQIKVTVIRETRVSHLAK